MKKLIGVMWILLIITPWTTYSQEVSEATKKIEKYTPLTSEEAENWLKSITLKELVDWIIIWDYMEHSSPIVEDFSYFIVLTNTDIAMVPQPEVVNIKMGQEENTFTYSLKLPTFQYKNVIQSAKPDRFWLGVGIGFGLGLLIGGLAVYGLSSGFT